MLGDLISSSATSAYMSRAVANNRVGAGYGPCSYHPHFAVGYPTSPRYPSASTGSSTTFIALTPNTLCNIDLLRRSLVYEGFRSGSTIPKSSEFPELA